MTDNPGSLDPRFSVRVRKDGAFATYVELPGPDELLGTRRAVKVTGTLESHPFAATLMPPGTGLSRLPLRAALSTAIGESRADQDNHRAPPATPHLIYRDGDAASHLIGAGHLPRPHSECMTVHRPATHADFSPCRRPHTA